MYTLSDLFNAAVAGMCFGFFLNFVIEGKPSGALFQLAICIFNIVLIFDKERI